MSGWNKITGGVDESDKRKSKCVNLFLFCFFRVIKAKVNATPSCFNPVSKPQSPYGRVGEKESQNKARTTIMMMMVLALILVINM